MDPRVIWCPQEDDRPEQLARDRARQLIGTQLVDDAELLVRDEQEQPEELGLDRRHGTQDVVDRQRIGR